MIRTNNKKNVRIILRMRTKYEVLFEEVECIGQKGGAVRVGGEDFRRGSKTGVGKKILRGNP